MVSSIWIDFMPGTSPKEAIKEAKDVARRCGVSYVKFELSGVDVMIGPEANVAKATLEFYRQMVKERALVTAY